MPPSSNGFLFSLEGFLKYFVFRFPKTPFSSSAAVAGRRDYCLPAALLLALCMSFASSGLAQVQDKPQALIHKLSDADPTVRGEAMRTLETMPSALVVPKVLEALNTADKDSAMRLVKVLVHHPDPTEIEPLIALAKKYDGLGSEVFALLGAEGARGLLSAVTKNCEAKVGAKDFPAWAGETASGIGPKARAVLKEQLTGEQPCVRKTALYGMAAVYRIRDANRDELEEAAELVIARLADSDGDVIETAERLLKPEEDGGRRYNATVEDFAPERLMKFFNAQKDPALRKRVLMALAAYGDPSVQEFMDHLAGDSDTAIQEIAQNYVPPKYEEEDRVHYTESPQSGVTPSEKAEEIEHLRQSSNPPDRVSARSRWGNPETFSIRPVSSNSSRTPASAYARRLRKASAR